MNSAIMKHRLFVLPFLVFSVGAFAQNKPKDESVRTATPLAVPGAYTNPVIN